MVLALDAGEEETVYSAPVYLLRRRGTLSCQLSGAAKGARLASETEDSGKPNLHSASELYSATRNVTAGKELTCCPRFGRFTGDGNCIDQNFVSQLNIPILPLEEPQEVLTINGKFLVKVTH